MINLSFKNCIFTILQVPILLIQLLVVYLDLLLTKGLTGLDNPLSSPFTTLAMNWAKREATTNQEAREAAQSHDGGQDKRIRIKNILGVLADSGYITIEYFRTTLEDTEFGRRAVQTNPDRHLYAVLVLNEAESLKRIENVLYEMPPSMLDGVLTKIKGILRSSK